MSVHAEEASFRITKEKDVGHPRQAGAPRPGRAFHRRPAAQHARPLRGADRPAEAMPGRTRRLSRPPRAPSAHVRRALVHGCRQAGDFSEHIKAGTIEKTPPPTEVRVPEDILSRGKAAYDDCVAELSALCTTVPGLALRDVQPRGATPWPLRPGQPHRAGRRLRAERIGRSRSRAAPARLTGLSEHSSLHPHDRQVTRRRESS